MMRKKIAFGAMTMASLVGLACAAPVEANAAEYTVTMANMSFGKLPSNAKVGDTIVWVNRDTVVHSATARDKSFDVRLPAGKSGRTTLTKAGDIAVYCIYHAQMRATLKVAAN
jgi:plastocyanin